MILKSLSRKSNPEIRQLIRYINRQEKQELSPLEREVEPFLWNLRTQENDTQTIADEFIENANHIRDQSGNRNRVLHEIISFHPEDKNKITAEILEDMGYQYLQLRAQDALGFAKPHFDRDSLHLHVVISGNFIASPRSSRVDRDRFDEIKRELEAFQRERYPELTHSVVFSPEQIKAREQEKERLKGNRSKDRDYNRDLRLARNGEKKLSKKEQVRSQIEAALNAKDRAGFEQLLALCEPPLTLYQRGQQWGVSRTETAKPTKRNPNPEPKEIKYRLNTLGIDFEAKLIEWELVQTRKPEPKREPQTEISPPVVELKPKQKTKPTTKTPKLTQEMLAGVEYTLPLSEDSTPPRSPKSASRKPSKKKPKLSLEEKRTLEYEAAIKARMQREERERKKAKERGDDLEIDLDL